MKNIQKENSMAEDGLNFQERLAELEQQRNSLIHRKEVADRFIQTANLLLREVTAEIELIRQFIDGEEINTIQPMEQISDDFLRSKFLEQGIIPEQPRRGAMTAREKEKKVKEAEAEKEKQKKEAAPAPNDKSRPAQPNQPNQPAQPEQPIKTPQERQEDITKKLIQRDPREQKKGLEELKKPENKDLGKDDPEFQKLIKETKKRVEKFDKIQENLRKNLRELMQSDSDVVKKNMAHLRAGRIGMGVAGFKEIAQSTDGRFNSVAGAAKGVCENVEMLYREFDIKPEEALSRETLNEAKPLFTRQMGTKSNEDKAIDRNSRQNRYLGESNELSEEERHTFKVIKEVYGVEAEKLPPTDVKTQQDMEIVRSIVHETALNPRGKINPIFIKNNGNSGL